MLLYMRTHQGDEKFGETKMLYIEAITKKKKRILDFYFSSVFKEKKLWFMVKWQ